MLQDLLSRSILGMSLPGKNKLHGPLCMVDHFQKALEVAEKKIPSLVGRDTTGETYRESIGREEPPGIDVLVDRFQRSRLFCTRPFADKGDEQILLPQMRFPDTRVGNRFDPSRPGILVVDKNRPVRAYKL